MLKYFKILSPTDLSVNLWQITNSISHHISNASLHYLVKCLCSKIAMTQSWVEQTSMQDSAIQKSCSKIFTQWHQNHFVHWRKGIYSDQTEKPTERPTVRISNNQEDVVQNACAHMASFGEQQVVNITSVWYTSITESRL